MSRDAGGRSEGEAENRDERGDEQGQNHGDAAQKGARRNSVLEYLVAGLGLLLVAAAVGFMALKVLTGGDAPPEVRLKIVRVTPSSGGYLVLIEARNSGDEAAAELGVEGTLERGGRTVETSDTTFDFLPPGSVREGGLFFSRDPRGALSLRVLGYREP